MNKSFYVMMDLKDSRYKFAAISAAPEFYPRLGWSLKADEESAVLYGNSVSEIKIKADVVSPDSEIYRLDPERWPLKKNAGSRKELMRTLIRIR